MSSETYPASYGRMSAPVLWSKAAKATGLDEAALAARLGLRPSHARDLARGGTTPRAQHWLALAAAVEAVGGQGRHGLNLAAVCRERAGRR